MAATSPIFSQEKDLISALTPSVARLLRTTRQDTAPGKKKDRLRALVLEQFAVGMTIPDLLIIQHKQLRHPKRTEISYFESSVLAELHYQGPKDEIKMSEALFSRPATVTSALLRLERLGAVARAETGEFCAIEGVIPNECQIISIEAKLRNWKEALSQALAYLRFSDYSYIALPEPLVASNSDIQQSCGAAGVGLISVSPRTRFIALSAQRNEELDYDRMWLLAKTIGLHRPTRATPRAQGLRGLPGETN